MHNTSAVMRSCEYLEFKLNVIEQRYGKSIDKEIAMGAQNGLISILSVLLIA
jgi:tRNA (guanosine-2'-O-)-methyltransferase